MSTELQKMIPVDIHKFRNTTRDITFDVYIKLSENNFAHVFSRNTGLDYKRLAQYIAKGVNELHIRAEDKDAYEAFVSTKVYEILQDPEAPQEKKIATLLNMTEQNMSEIFTQLNITGETAAGSKKLIQNYVSLMGESPKTLSVLLKLASHGDYLYYHSIAVSIFSMFIAKATGKYNRQGLETIALGGFLHDIGHTQLPREILDSPNELSEGEWEIIHQHTKVGINMLGDDNKFSKDVRLIIFQHHEDPGGEGYPSQLKAAAIAHPARIVALADSFSALISKRPYRPAYSVEKAIEILKTGKRKHDSELVEIVASIFLSEFGKPKAA